MSAVEVAAILNGVLQILATIRRMGVTNDELKALLDSDEEVTPEMVQESLDRLQQAIDAGRSP